MRKINLKNDLLQIYKRENSKAWQIKLKLPRQKAIRKSSGSKILEEAKKTALGIYDKIVKNKKYAFIFIGANFSYHGGHGPRRHGRQVKCFIVVGNYFIG